jgi:hypothetical protein
LLALAAPTVTSPAAHAADPGNGFAPAAANVAVASLASSGVDRAAATRILADQPANVARAERLAHGLGSRSAGAYLDPRTGAVVVNVLDASAERAVRAAGATPKLVKHTSAALNTAIGELNRTVRVPNTAWAIDVAANQVVVTISDSVRGAGLTRMQAAVAKLGAMARVEHSKGPFIKMIAGGDEIRADAGWICSAGFNATRGGANYIVTAGHCTQGLPNWTSAEGNIGPSTNSNFPTTDFGLIRNTGATPVAGVTLYNGSIQAIRSASGGSVGENVCKSGRTTQITCGRVSALNATVDYGNGDVVYGLIQTNVRANPGDSGGALFDGTTGLGMTSGGNSSTTYFQPLPAALSTYGVTLLGGTPPNPGGNLALNRPATGSASCNASEGPEKAVNGSVSGGNSDKWCSLAAGTKRLQVDLGRAADIRRIVVKHASAGGENASWNTRDFNLQVSQNGTTFTTVASVTGNTSGTTTNSVSANGRYVRLNITTPTQDGDPATRIYELEVYA